jgi:hypothetical protein
MSSSLYVYVGPCLKLPQIESVAIHDRHRCSNSSCKNHAKLDRDFDFCPACGSKGEEVQDKVTYRSDLETSSLYDLEEKYNLESEVLYHVTVNESSPDEQSYWLPNLHHAYRTENYNRYDENNAFEVNPRQIMDDLLAFTKDHQAIIDAFKAEYDIDMPVVYATVPYYM